MTGNNFKKHGLPIHLDKSIHKLRRSPRSGWFALPGDSFPGVYSADLLGASYGLTIIENQDVIFDNILAGVSTLYIGPTKHFIDRRQSLVSKVSVARMIHDWFIGKEGGVYVNVP